MTEPVQSEQTTRLLNRLSAGDEAAADELLPLVYDELRASAGRLMGRERGDHTLQSTALIHEAWLRLVRGPAVEWQGRAHFLRVAARAMRNVLVDHARERAAQKRGGGHDRQPLDEALATFERDGTRVLALHEALERLAQREHELAQIVELRFFGGLTLRETGEVLGRSVDQVHDGWNFARSWLSRELSRSA